MIYKKPGFAYSSDLHRDGISIGSGAGDLLSFLRSLPAEFEIVDPGMTQVRWPEGVTRSELDGWCDDLTRYVPENADILRYLRQLAAIAPVEKKKRKVNLYERHDKLLGWVRVWDHLEFHELQPGWRKVGECEVSE